MRHLTHSELHKLIDNDFILKEKSDRVHTLPSDVLNDWRDGKYSMMEIYAEAVGCNNVENAKLFVEKVFVYIGLQCSSKREWFNIASLSEHKDVLGLLRQEYVLKRLCHSSGGNDYMCYCDEKHKNDDSLMSTFFY